MHGGLGLLRQALIRASFEIYIRLKGAGSAEIFEALQKQGEEIEKAIGAELHWQVKVKGEKYQIGLELDSAATGEDTQAAQFEWLHEMAKRFAAVFGPLLKAGP